MKFEKIWKVSIAFVILFAAIFAQAGCSPQLTDKKIPVRVLILPKFESGELAGDFPGGSPVFL